MQDNWLQIAQSFNTQESFVLATICQTKGSTYRKIGTMMLISAEGVCTGLLSGGCLEADICLHAEQVLKENKTSIINYDLKADSDLLWGLGLGCDGAIDILLQPLTPENHHLDFEHVLAAVKRRESGIYCQKIMAQSPPSAKYIASVDKADNKDSTLAEFNGVDEKNTTLVIPIIPPISVVICGAGPDVEPVAHLLRQMGWHLAIWDHRQHYLDQPCFERCQKKKCRPEHIAATDFSSFDAAVIMTHNLESDMCILDKAWHSQLSYIGVLGPKARLAKLIEPIPLLEDEIEGRVYGPIGLDLGGRGPQAIALSITAQIQQHFSIQSERVKEAKPYVYGELS
ncbi:XdhC family protein [Thalassotalea piscium]